MAHWNSADRNGAVPARIRVATARRYDVVIGRGLAGELVTAVRDRPKAR